MNKIKYMFEVNMDINETHSPISMKIIEIQNRIPTRNLLEQEM